ncbi:MAG: type II toxin-antitoxin system Phd/YefM family antitoxin [Anaerolineae bacterium]
MGHVWQLQEAKSKLSQVVEGAIAEGPQVITRRGVEVAVVLSYAEYAKLSRPKTDLVQFFQESPLAGLDLSRDRSLPRRDVVL